MTPPTQALVVSARLALGFAIFLALAEIRRNWGDWGYWPFWVVDYIAVGLLLAGWRASLSNPPSPRGPGILCGAWGFACAMFYGSFFSHLERYGEPDHGPDDPVALTIVIGVMFAFTIAGFALALAGAGARGIRS